MAKIPGTAVASGIVPSDDRSALPTHYAEYGKGGLRRVATIAALNNIPVERREYGMLVFVDAVESFYQVGPAPAYAFGAAPFVPGPGTDTIYASTSAGLAAVSEGEYFYVADADGLHLYRDVAGAATAIGDFPTTAVLAAQVSAAQTAANDADAAKTAAETAQGLAEAAQEGAAVSEAAASSSATAAASSATTASGHATQAGVYRDQARAAADASSPQYFFDTYAAAEAALSSIPDDAVVEVWEDETHSDYRTRYLKEPGNLVFKVQFESDSLKTDLQTTGSDKGADIPYFLPYGSVKQVRSVQAKLRETISFADKGAIPNDSSLAAKNTNTAAINAAFADALATGAIVVSDNKEYHVNGTISPKSAFTWQSFDTTITFDPSGTYTEIEDNVGAGSGKYVAFDTLGCNNLNHFGALTLKSASPSSMTHANRQSINANLIAMSCSTAATPSTGTGDGSEASWGNVAISGFGGAFYQADQTGGVANILPYTRTHFRLLKIQFCINPIVSGANGAGFDDLWVDVMRISRCAGTNTIRSTDFSGGSFFWYGLSDDDAEPETASTTGSSAVITTSADMSAKISTGTILAIGPNGSSAYPDSNKAAGGIPFVSRVQSVSGTTVTLEEVVPNTVAGCKLFIDPLSTTLVGGSQLCATHLFLEGYFGNAIQLSSDAKLICPDFKISSGTFAGRLGGPILLTRLMGLVDIACHSKTVSSPMIKRLVSAGMLRDTPTSADSQHNVTVRVRNTLAASQTYANLIELVAIPSSLRGGLADRSSFTLANTNYRIVAGDATHFLRPVLGQTVYYRQTELGLAGGVIKFPDGSNLTNTTLSATNGVATTVFAASTLVSSGVYLVFARRSAATPASVAMALVVAGSGTPPAALTVANLVTTGGSFSASGGDIQFTNTDTTASVGFSIVRHL